jgi:hypothetical protein
MTTASTMWCLSPTSVTIVPSAECKIPSCGRDTRWRGQKSRCAIWWWLTEDMWVTKPDERVQRASSPVLTAYVDDPRNGTETLNGCGPAAEEAANQHTTPLQIHCDHWIDFSTQIYRAGTMDVDVITTNECRGPWGWQRWVKIRAYLDLRN